jgi:hypothetical protein
VRWHEHDHFGSLMPRTRNGHERSSLDHKRWRFIRSAAGMTYAGLKSMIYAGLTQDDPRVKAALEYIKQHFMEGDPHIVTSFALLGLANSLEAEYPKAK